MLEKNLKVLTTTLYDTYPFLYYRTILSINGYTVFIYTGGESEEDCERIAMNKYFNNEDTNIIPSRVDLPIKLDIETQGQPKTDTDKTSDSDPKDRIEIPLFDNLDISIGRKIYDIKEIPAVTVGTSKRFGTNNLVTGTGHFFDPRYW